MSTTRRRLAGVLGGLRGGGRGWILLSIALGWLLTLGLRFLIPALLTQVKSTFVIDNATAGVAVTAVWAFYGLTQFPAGLVAGRIGERTVLAGSLALSAASLTLLAGAPVFAVFLVGAAAYGFSSGLYGPARGMALSKAFPRNSGAAFGLALASGSLGSAVLPLVAGVTVAALGWRLLVALAVPLFLGVAILAWRSLPDPIDALSDVEEPEPAPTASLRETVRGVPAAIRDREVFFVVVGVTFYLFAFQGLTSFLPTYLVEQEGVGQGVAAGVFALFFVSGGASQLVSGALADRFGTAPVLVGIGVLDVLTLSSIPFAEGLPVWVALTLLLGTRMGVAPVANSYVIEALPDSVQGASWGFLRTCFFLIGATGSVFVGTMADANLFDEAFLVLAGLTATGTAFFYGLSRVTRD